MSEIANPQYLSPATLAETCHDPSEGHAGLLAERGEELGALGDAGWVDKDAVVAVDFVCCEGLW